MVAESILIDAPSHPNCRATQAPPSNGWTFNIAPYLWFSTVNASLDYNLPPALGGRLPTDVSVGPGDVLGHLDFGVMFAADARNGPFSILTDFVGAKFSASGSNVTAQKPVTVARQFG